MTFFQKIKLSPYRISTLLGFFAVCWGVLAHLYNYHLAPPLLPGYEIFAWPGMFSLSFFSEETAYKPKLIIFLLGQFIGYFGFCMLWYKIKDKLKTRRK